MIEKIENDLESIPRTVYWQKVALLFTPMAFVLGLLLLGFYWYTFNNSIRILEDNERNIVKLYNDSLSGELAFILSDLKILAHQHELQNFVDNGPTENKDLETDYLTFSKEKKIYDQIRFLDHTGMERIRVNYNAGKPIVVEQGNLQNKVNRYYFAETFALQRNEIFISPLDLNIENGEIETPLKPMIRFGMPVFDRNGKKQGIMLLNFLAERMLNNINQLSQHSFGESMLINTKGYWLQGVTKEDEWGFMFEERKNLTFKERYPEDWDYISKTGKGQITDANGLFTFDIVSPLKSVVHDGENTSNYHWIIVSRVSPEVISEQIQAERKTLIYSAFLLTGLLLALSIIKTNSSIAQKLSQQSIKQKNAALQDNQKKLESAVSELTDSNELLNTTVDELETALEEIKTLRGIVPICSFCKGIPNDKGSWVHLENYIEQHSDAEFSHGICDKCLEKHYPEDADEINGTYKD